MVRQYPSGGCVAWSPVKSAQTSPLAAWIRRAAWFRRSSTRGWLPDGTGERDAFAGIVEGSVRVIIFI